jgi:phospholipase D1/2
MSTTEKAMDPHPMDPSELDPNSDAKLDERPDSAGASHRGTKEKLAHPFPSLREKLKDMHLYDVKIKAVHAKNKLGKFKNLFNTNHRHDEEHEQKTDEKRTRVCENHRFESFAPERDGNMVKWYVDGRDYFWAVSVALENAKETIYIEDWWLSPELFLRRPPFYNHDFRLDALLKRKAVEGVKIYIIVYKEVQDQSRP